jgi:hypothetical protein
LNINQQNALEVEMREWELTILDLRRDICGAPQEGRLTIVQPIPESLRKNIDERLEMILTEIRNVAEEFNLPPQISDLSRKVIAYLSLASSDLQDLRVSKLKRYGAADPGLTDTLEPHILNLSQMSMDICEIIDSQQASTHAVSQGKKNRNHTHSDGR